MRAAPSKHTQRVVVTHTDSVPFFRSQIICGDLVETLGPIPKIIRKTVIHLTFYCGTNPLSIKKTNIKGLIFPIMFVFSNLSIPTQS
ncbi:hypothetical protein J2Z65_003823 [Paenibacillus aceris]|uniref:Uncharacterized protein n=1 Tax=Paenibacillus aceris TaxID=869555 RepID=A0ABS4I130_9BACL|nr:hypothetical protein [Paenibacillus aceris]